MAHRTNKQTNKQRAKDSIQTDRKSKHRLTIKTQNIYIFNSYYYISNQIKSYLIQATWPIAHARTHTHTYTTKHRTNTEDRYIHKREREQ